MFFLVEGYSRTAAPDAITTIGVIDSQAVLAPQLGGVILRMMQRLGANMVVVTTIPEEVFMLFYQEQRERRGNGRS
jgi:hypothetical protein